MCTCLLYSLKAFANFEPQAHTQAAMEWSAVCLSEYRQFKPLTAIMLPLFVNTFSKHTHTHTRTQIQNTGFHKLGHIYIYIQL